ncbi:dimethylarginine dimethylaminohydrolase family protein [Rhodovibrionaceae bacterium A322]
MSAFNEYGPLMQVGLRTAKAAFKDQAKAAAEWEELRFHAEPLVEESFLEYDNFEALIRQSGAEVISVPAADALTLDAIYVRDACLISPKGLILCNMGRPSRNNEPDINADIYEDAGFTVAGRIEAPGTLEGGDFIWLSETAAAVGLGPRTNEEGIRQLKAILGPEVDLEVVQLPDPSHPDDVFHLMSMISPLDKDLALIYRPLMPGDFITWLESYGIGFVEVPEEEFLPMGCNVLATGPRQVLMLDKLPLTKAALEAAGCTVTTYKGDEISRKGEGGPTCLTRPLTRG